MPILLKAGQILDYVRIAQEGEGGLILINPKRLWLFLPVPAHLKLEQWSDEAIDRQQIRRL